MEARFYVPLGGKERFEELFRGNAKGLGVTSLIEFVAWLP